MSTIFFYLYKLPLILIFLIRFYYLHKKIEASFKQIRMFLILNFFSLGHSSLYLMIQFVYNCRYLWWVGIFIAFFVFKYTVKSFICSEALLVIGLQLVQTLFWFCLYCILLLIIYIFVLQFHFKVNTWLDLYSCRIDLFYLCLLVFYCDFLLRYQR